MTSNEKELLEAIVNHPHVVEEAQKTIKEKFGCESEYDEDNLTLHLKAQNINESLKMICAEQYVKDNVDCVDVVVDYNK